MKQPLIILSFLIVAISGQSQYRSNIITTFSTPGGPGISGGGNIGFTQDVNSPSVPFDGGLSLILAATGIGYCGRRFKKAV